MKVERESFLEALRFVMLGVSSESESSNIVILSDKWVRSFDGRISVSYPFKTGIRCGLSVEKLMVILKKLKGKTIELGIKSDMFYAKTSKSVLKVPILDQVEENFFDLDDISFEKLPKDFKTGMELCAHSMSLDTNKGVLCGMCFDGDNIMTTDGYKASRYIMEDDMQGEFVIPMEFVKEFIKVNKEFKEYAFDEDWIHFRESKKSDVVISARLLSGDYPTEDIEGFLEQGRKGKKGKFPAELMDAADRAEVLSGEDLKDFATYISIRKEDDVMYVQGRRSSGEYTEKISCEGMSFLDDKELIIDPASFKEILKITRQFRLHEKNEIISFSIPNFEHIMIVLLKEYEDDDEEDN